jgi:hypothetical protein
MATLQQISAAMQGFPRTLSWRDFRSVATSLKPPMDAQTGAGFQLQPWSVEKTNGEYRVLNPKMVVTLNSSNTWVVQGKTSSALLVHEQGHFDIAGLIARDMISRILDLSLDEAVIDAVQGSGKTAQSHMEFATQRLQAYIQDYNKDAANMMNTLGSTPASPGDGLYDRQTNHSQNAVAQAAWNSRLARIQASPNSFEFSLIMEGVVSATTP